jgi:ribonuclease HII
MTKQSKTQSCLKMAFSTQDERQSPTHTLTAISTVTNRQLILPYFEIGVDEAGRGPMFGRVYASAVVLPYPEDNPEFKYHLLKDSKKFHSQKRIHEVSDYIKQNAIAWSIAYATEEEIDEVNIRKATHRAMTRAIRDVFTQLETKLYRQEGMEYYITTKHTLPYHENEYHVHLYIDGNDFTDLSLFKKEKESYITIPHTCVIGGDNEYASIAAASILSKVARDDYIEALCQEHPELDEKYGIQHNKGYGTKIHLDGIRTHGITMYHRKTFGLCKQFVE